MSQFFSWNSGYDLGVKAMNNEHRTLIDLMNQLYEAHGSGSDFEELKTIFLKLEAYTLTHFSDEEKFMAEINFPDLEVHKLIHADLLKKLEKHKQEFLTKKELGPSLFDFLKMWLSAHIRGIDMKYADFDRSRAR